jgi:hypothetical protein
MNLAIFVDKGKIDDIINFQDIGVMFVFDIEVTQVFDKSMQMQQQAVIA